MKRFLSLGMIVMVTIFLGASFCLAQNAVNDNEIVIGMSAAFSGPAAALGNGMKAGIEGYFDYINKNGGVNGRKLVLKSMDDKYEPANTVPNVKTLINKDKVFAMIGNVGTPTSLAALPLILEAKIPLVGAFTGSAALRKNDRYVINYRASYAEETEAMVEGLVQDLGIKPSEIAFFTQNDTYGDSGFNGGITALKKQGLSDVSKVVRGKYERNTLAIDGALQEIMAAKPKAVIMVGTYEPTAKFVKAAKAKGLDAIFSSVSFVGSEALATWLGKSGEGVIVTQVVPHYNSLIKTAVEYRQQVDKTQQNFVSFEGYLAAKLLVEGLKKTGKTVTVEKFIDTLEGMSELSSSFGFKVTLSAADHQASHKVWPTLLKDGKFVAMRSWKEAKE